LATVILNIFYLALLLKNGFISKVIKRTNLPERINQNLHRIGLFKEAQKSSRQIHESQATHLVKLPRPNILLALFLAVETAYFLSSVIDGNMLIRTVLAFPAAYILPGFVLRLLTSKPIHEDILRLIVESFVISTIINVVTLSLLILLNTHHYYFLLPLSQLLLVIFSVVLMKVRHSLPKLSVSKVDGSIILACFIVYLIAVTLYSLTPRLPTPDETKYIVNARYTLLDGKVYDTSAGLAMSPFTYLIKGRFFWTLLTASFLASTGLEPCFSHLLSPMFLSMIPIASLPLLPTCAHRRRGLLRFSLTIVLLTNPLLFYFSGFVLNEVALVFYITFALALFVNSFKRDRLGESIDFSKLILCFSVFFMAMVFIKPNMTVFLPMYVVLLFFALRHKTRVVYKRFGYVLLALPIIYELLIDVPFNLSKLFLKNEFFAHLTSKFIWVSPIEYFSGFFVARPWKSTTLFSHDTTEYLQLLYTMVSPEALGLILASMALAVPLALTLKWVRRDRKMITLTTLLTTTLPMQYFLIISNYSFRDAPRWGLFLFPMIVAFSLAILIREIDEHNVSTLLMFCIPSVLFLWIFAFLILRVGEIYFYYSYEIPQYLNWTINIVVPQLIVSILVLSLMSAKRTASISVRVPFARLKRMKHVSLSKILYSTLIMAIIMQNVYFSLFCVNNSSFFGQEHGLEDTDKFLASSNDSSMIFSNTYIYIRNYVSDNVLAEGRLFPPPRTENEFLQLIDFAPNGSLILISTDPEVAWIEYANDYIKKYSNLDIIMSNTSKGYAIRIKNEQLSTGQISLFRTVNSFTSNGVLSIIIVNDARLVWLNRQEKVLEMNIFSSTPSYIKTIIKTDHFVELLNITLSPGNNIVRLGGDSYYKQYVTKVMVFIEDQNGNKVYDEEVTMFNVEGIQLSFTLVLISILLGVLFLTRRSKHMRVRAYPVRESSAEKDSSKTRALK